MHSEKYNKAFPYGEKAQSHKFPCHLQGEKQPSGSFVYFFFLTPKPHNNSVVAGPHEKQNILNQLKHAFQKQFDTERQQQVQKLCISILSCTQNQC